MGLVVDMTENKRFTYLDYSRDGHIGSFYLNDKPITNKEVCDLLNEQEEEIKSLKLENKLLLEEMKEIRDKLTIYFEIKGDVE